MDDIIKIFAILLTVDLPYLYLMKDYYGNMIEDIQKTKIDIRYFSILIVYIIMAISIKYFVIDNSKNIYDILFYGILLGLFGYGVYDFTNYSIFSKWRLNASLIDLAWGMFLCTFVSLIFYIFVKN